MSAKLAADETRYSDTVPGDERNYNLPATFDLSDGGYVGITQNRDRILLSPKQVRELLKFLGMS